MKIVIPGGRGSTGAVLGAAWGAAGHRVVDRLVARWRAAGGQAGLSAM